MTTPKWKLITVKTNHCDFKTNLTLVFKQHINTHDGPKRESSEETSSEESFSEESSSEDSSIENYGCAKYYFEPNLSLKSFQHMYFSMHGNERKSSKCEFFERVIV